MPKQPTKKMRSYIETRNQLDMTGTYTIILDWVDKSGKKHKIKLEDIRHNDPEFKYRRSQYIEDVYWKALEQSGVNVNIG